MATDPGLLDRLPPQNQEAERCVLGAMLRDNRTIDEVLQIIRKEDFYTDGHQKIFETMVALNDEGGRPVDPVILHVRASDQMTGQAQEAHLQVLGAPVDAPEYPGDVSGDKR